MNGSSEETEASSSMPVVEVKPFAGELVDPMNSSVVDSVVDVSSLLVSSDSVVG